MEAIALGVGEPPMWGHGAGCKQALGLAWAAAPRSAPEASWDESWPELRDVLN